VAVVVGALLAAAAMALADPPAGQNPNGKMLGVITPKGNSGKNSGTPVLLYHGGVVMDANKTYTIFWAPPPYSFATGYINLINQFFGDVAAADGSSSNVYAVATQYYGPSNELIQYGSHVGDTVTDSTTPYNSGCKAKGTTACVTDAQLQAEVQSVIALKGWPTNTGGAYFVFLPQNVGTCAGGCFPNNWCAYHSWIDTSSETILYANMPFQDQTPACDGGQHPNSSVDPNADATIDAVSHEHNEMITDPVGTAWFTKNGYEEADLCNFVYGSLSGTSPSQFNQAINRNKYFAQEEWSNASSTCVQHYP